MALLHSDLQKLANLRAKDAKVLLDNGQFDAAFYLAGYAIECALKAVIAARTLQHEFPDLKFTKDVHTHDLKKLLDLAGLQKDIEQAKDPDLRNNWTIVRDWKETNRYESGKNQGEAEALYKAIADPAHGVLPCITTYW